MCSMRFVHKHIKNSHFGLTYNYKMSCELVTGGPIFVNLVLKDAWDLWNFVAWRPQGSLSQGIRLDPIGNVCLYLFLLLLHPSLYLINTSDLTWSHFTFVKKTKGTWKFSTSYFKAFLFMKEMHKNVYKIAQ